MNRFIAIFAVFLFVSLPVAALAQEPAEGTIYGQVINGTEGGGSVDGVTVTLITYIDDTIAGTRTTTTDAEGKFQFINVATEHTYLVSPKYMEVDYYYPVSFEPGEESVNVEVGVCDTTDSDEAIRVGMGHAIIDIEAEILLVTEVLWLVNDVDKTYVGTNGVLVFTLPEGAFDFNAPQDLMMDFQFLDDNRITYLVPFPPGERQLAYSYRLAKTDTDDFNIMLEMDYPTDSFDLMVKGEDIEVTVSQLTPAEPVVTDIGERYIHFRGLNFPRGKEVDIYLSNLSGGSNLSLVIIWVIIAVLVAGIVIYLLRRKKKANDNE